MMRVINIAIIAIIAFSASVAAALETTDVFTAGMAGYHTYRIPAIIVTQKGTILAFAEARKNSPSDHGDIDLVVRRSADGGKTWGNIIMIFDRGEQTVGNPSPVVDTASGKIILPFTIDNDGVFVTTSSDDGLTWSTPREITASVKKPDWKWYATGPGHAIQLSSGRILVPSDHSNEKGMYSHVIYSDDHGETWSPGGSLAEKTDEATAVELEDGTVMINMRNNYGRFQRAVATSADGGVTWSKINFAKSLIEPVCEGSIIRLSSSKPRGKSRILFSNPGARTREKLTLRISYDEGKTWPASKVINTGKSGYSDIAALPDGGIGIIYENGTKAYHDKITFARVSLEWLTDGRDKF